MIRASGLGLVLAALSGGCCMAVRVRSPEPLGRWPSSPLEPEELRSLSLSFSARCTVAGQDAPFGPEVWLVCRNATLLAYHRSGLFADIWLEGEPAELEADVVLRERRTLAPRALRIAHGLTLGIVPCWERREWTLETAVSAERGRKPLARFEKSAAAVTWSHLLLFIVYPFAPPPGVGANCVYDLSRATILDARARGVF